MYQKMIIAGNVGQEPMLRYLPTGTAVTTFSVATSFKEKKGDEWVDGTNWWNVVTYGKLAELCSQHLEKGKKVLVEAEPRMEHWEAADGAKRSALKLRADKVVFLSPKSQGQPSSDVGDSSTDTPFGESELPF